MTNHCANFEDMDDVNTNKLFKSIEFEDIMDQESNEKYNSTILNVLLI